MSATQPSRSEVDDALRTIVDLSDSIDDDHQGSGTVQINGSQSPAHTFTHGSHTYHVAGQEGMEFLTMLYPVNLASALANERLEADVGPNEAEQVLVQANEAQVQSAREDIRQSVDGDSEQIRQGLVDRLSQPNFALEMDTVDTLPVGFHLTSKLFVYHDDPDPQMYSDRVQSLISLGWKGQQYLITEFNLEELLDQDDEDGGRIGFE